MAVLRIVLPESLPLADQPLAWAHFSADGKIIAQGNSSLAAMPRVSRCEAIAPAVSVLLTRVKLPVQHGEKARRLLPFAIEEQLAVESERVQLALGAALPDGQVAVAAVDKAWLQAWKNALAQHDLPLRHLHPETLLPPLHDGAWSMVWQGDSGWVRSGLHSGWALASASAASLQLAHAPALVLYADSLPAWLQAMPIKVTLKSRWQWLNAPSPSFDLLQGEFAPQALRWQDWKQFRWAAILASALLLVHILGTGIEVWRLQREQKSLQSSMEATFRQAFPEATVVVDPVLQMERQRAALRRTAGLADSHDFLALLQLISPVLAAAQAQKLHYDNQVLQLELTLPDAATVEALRSRVAQSGFKNELLANGQTVQLKVWQP